MAKCPVVFDKMLFELIKKCIKINETQNIKRNNQNKRHEILRKGSTQILLTYFSQKYIYIIQHITQHNKINV